jgi:hypothetical protein
LPETELEALVAHISQNGQLHPVIIHEEMILDGRSRASACEHAKISLRTEPLPKGVDPIDYVVGANLRRRQLTPAQRAIVAAKLMPHYQAEAAARKRALSGTRTNPNGSQPEVPEILPEPEECGEAREKAAKATGANARNVTDAVKLQRGAPDLFQAVESATMSIPKALRELEKRGERVEQETSPARDAFLVVLWDDAGAQPTRAPEKSYGSKTYPNIAFFRFYEAGTAKIESAAKHGLNPVAVFSVPVDPTVMIKDKEGRSFCRASCRYLALSVRGSVPEPSKVPGQLIEGGCEGVIKTIELMFPNDLKAISDTNGEPPPGWEHFPRATKADVSQTASGSASNSPKRPEPRSVDVSKVPSSAADSPTAVKKTAAKIENRPAPRKAKLTTVRGHLNKLHHGICSIAVELRRIQDKLPESFHQLDSFRAREQAIPPLEAASLASSG